MKKIIKILGSIILACVLAFAGLVSYLMITEYKPHDMEKLTVVQSTKTHAVKLNTEYNALDWNVGYFGMDKDVDFFMDGGKWFTQLTRRM